MSDIQQTQNYDFFSGLGKVFTSTVNASVEAAGGLEDAARTGRRGIRCVDGIFKVCEESIDSMNADREDRLVDELKQRLEQQGKTVTIKDKK